MQNKIRKSEQEDSVDKKTETKLKLMNKLKKLKPCLGGTQTRKNTHILPSLQEGVFRHHNLLFILKGYLQKLVTCTNKIWNQLLSKISKKNIYS